MSRCARQIKKPLIVDGVRVLAKMPKLITEYLIEAESKLAVRYALCVSDESEDRIPMSKCSVL